MIRQIIKPNQILVKHKNRKKKITKKEVPPQFIFFVRAAYVSVYMYYICMCVPQNNIIIVVNLDSYSIKKILARERDCLNMSRFQPNCKYFTITKL